MSLSEIKAVAAKQNPINTFYVYSLDAKTLTADSFIVAGNLEVDGNLEVKGSGLFDTTLEVKGTAMFDSNANITSANPVLGIRNSAINTNPAQLQLAGRYPTIGPVTLLSSETGAGILRAEQSGQPLTIQTFGVGAINLTTASTGLVNITNPLITTCPNITQTGSSSGAVTLNSTTGTITTVSLTTASGAQEAFTFNNSFITATSVVMISVSTYGSATVTGRGPIVYLSAQTGGSASVNIMNVGASALASTVKLSFIIMGT